MNKLGLLKEECGHPTDWNMRLVNNGKTYTYCMGCVVEKLGLDNLEAYSNPFVKVKEPVIAAASTIKKAKKTKE